MQTVSGKDPVRIYEKERHKIDLVILDMIMPDMGGGDVYDKIKEINPGVNVLLSSGFSIEGRATEILVRGYNGFIQKPFKINELSNKMKGILNRE